MAGRQLPRHTHRHDRLREDTLEVQHRGGSLAVIALVLAVLVVAGLVVVAMLLVGAVGERDAAGPPVTALTSV